MTDDYDDGDEYEFGLVDYMMFRRTLSSVLEIRNARKDGDFSNLSERAQSLFDFIGIGCDLPFNQLEKYIRDIEMNSGVKVLNNCTNYLDDLESVGMEYCVEFPRELDELPDMFGFEVSGQRENPHSEVEPYLLENVINGDIEFVQGKYGAVLATKSEDVARAYVALYINIREQQESSLE